LPDVCLNDRSDGSTFSSKRPLGRGVELREHPQGVAVVHEPDGMFAVVVDAMKGDAGTVGEPFDEIQIGFVVLDDEVQIGVVFCYAGKVGEQAKYVRWDRLVRQPLTDGRIVLIHFDPTGVPSRRRLLRRNACQCRCSHMF
jgi:hypothetical protein